MVTSLGWILRAPRDLHASLDLFFFFLKVNTCIYTVVRKNTKSTKYKYKEDTGRIQADNCPHTIAKKPLIEKTKSKRVLKKLLAHRHHSSSPNSDAVTVAGGEDLQHQTRVPKRHLAMKLFEPPQM
jgi:hypothetical protein